MTAAHKKRAAGEGSCHRLCLGHAHASEDEATPGRRAPQSRAGKGLAYAMVVEVDDALTWRGADSRETGTCPSASAVTADFSRETPAATTATAATMDTMAPMAATGAVSMLSLVSMALRLVSMVSNLSLLSLICCWGLARGRGGGGRGGGRRAWVIVVW